MLSSVLSLAWASSKSFFLHRLPTWEDPDPPLKFLLLMLLKFLIVITPTFVLAWAVLLSYMKDTMLIAFLVTFVLNSLFLQMNIRGSAIEEIIDQKSFQVQGWKMKFWAILTSMLSPCIPIHHGLNILQTSGFCTVLCLLSSFCMCIAMIPSLNITPFNSPPIAYCFRNEALTGEICLVNGSTEIVECGQRFLRFCTEENCLPSVRFCDSDENPLDMMTYVIMPILCVLLLISMLEISGLQWLSSFTNLQRTHLCWFKFIHRGLLFSMIDNVDIEGLKDILKGRKEEIEDIINKQKREGDTPLHRSCQGDSNDNAIMTQLLLDKGANRTIMDTNENIPFYVAAERNNLKCCEAFIGNNQNLEMEELLHRATGDGRAWVVKVLLTMGADVESPQLNRSKKTPLHFAAEKDRREVASLLLDWGADIEANDAYSLTPLHYAAIYNSYEVADLLLGKGVIIDSKDSTEWTPLHWAVGENYMDMVKLLLHESRRADVNAREKDGWTPLHFAVDRDRSEAADFLLCNGADIEERSNNGWTPLHRASLLNRKEVSKKLFKHGADIGTRTIQGEAPMHLAAKNNSVEVAELLLREGADVEAENPKFDGVTPLIEAAIHNCREVADLLLDNGAEIDAQDVDGLTALHHATSRSRVEFVKALLRKGADAKARTNNGRRALEMANDARIRALLQKAVLQAGEEGLGLRSNDSTWSRSESRESNHSNV